MDASAILMQAPPESGALPAAQAASRRFVIWLLAAAASPIPIFALLSGPLAAHTVTPSVFYVVMLTNLMHVGLSALFFLDARYRSHMAAQPRYYYWDTLLLGGLSLLCLVLAGQVFFNIFAIGIVSWNIYHAERQNWGVLCLTALGTSASRPSRLESHVCNIGSLGCAILVLPPQVIAMLPDHTLMAGYACIVAGILVSLALAIRQLAMGEPLLRVGMTAAVGAFFLPMCFLPPTQGLIAIGAVHTMQYAIIMTVLAADRGQGSRVFRIGGMFALAAVYLAITQVMGNQAIWGGWWQATQVIMSTVAAWHFMIDAGLFRLGQPAQRRAMQESFAFLFARAPKTA